MEIESAVRRHLLRDNTVRGYVEERVWKFRLEEAVDQTGLAALVVVRGNGWATPQPRNTQEYPILHVDAVVDPAREISGEIARLDAEDRAFALARVVNGILHGLRGVRLGGYARDPGLMVNSCQRWSEPRLITGADMHPPTAGDTVKVRSEFAFDVVH